MLTTQSDFNKTSSTFKNRKLNIRSPRLKTSPSKATLPEETLNDLIPRLTTAGIIYNLKLESKSGCKQPSRVSKNSVKSPSVKTPKIRNDSKQNTHYSSFKYEDAELPKTAKVKNKHEENINIFHKPFSSFLSNNQVVEPKIVIKNPHVKKLLRDIDNYGPYYSHCPTHNRRNLEFFGKMKAENSIKLLSFIKEYRNKHKLVI